MDHIKVVNINKTSSKPRIFIDGSKRYVARLSSMEVGRGIYNPGWRWSIHAGPQMGKASARHIGWIQSGKMIIRTESGSESKLGPGDFFEVGPNHDAWVVGSKPCIALDFACKD